MGTGTNLRRADLLTGDRVHLAEGCTRCATKLLRRRRRRRKILGRERILGLPSWNVNFSTFARAEVTVADTDAMRAGECGVAKIEGNVLVPINGLVQRVISKGSAKFTFSQCMADSKLWCIWSTASCHTHWCGDIDDNNGFGCLPSFRVAVRGVLCRRLS
jgi:hypothetical protein